LGLEGKQVIVYKVAFRISVNGDVIDEVDVVGSGVIGIERKSKRNYL
jgi:hypothetical protein